MGKEERKQSGGEGVDKPCETGQQCCGDKTGQQGKKIKKTVGAEGEVEEEE